MYKQFSPETRSDIFRLFGRGTSSAKLDLHQLKAANPDVILFLTQLSHALHKWGVNNFLDIGCAETTRLKKHINMLCHDTDEARNLLRLHLLLLHIEDDSLEKSSYDKAKIKALYKELAMYPNGKFKKNLESIATRKIFELTDFDKAGARQSAIDLLAEIKTLSITQSAPRY